IESLPARIPDMQRRLHTGEELDKVSEAWVAARVSAAADGDPAHLVRDDLEAGKDVIGDLPEVPEPPVVLPHAPATVIASLFIRRAVAAAERGSLLHVPEIAVLAKAP